MRSNIKKHLKLMDQLAKTEADLTVLKTNKTPPGIVPFKVPFECDLLESPLSDKTEQVIIDFPTGTTLREARHKMYFQMLVWNKEIEIKLEKRKLESIKPLINYKSFLEQCCNKNDAEH